MISRRHALIILPGLVQGPRLLKRSNLPSLTSQISVSNLSMISISIEEGLLPCRGTDVAGALSLLDDYLNQGQVLDLYNPCFRGRRYPLGTRMVRIEFWTPADLIVPQSSYVALYEPVGAQNGLLMIRGC